MIRLVAHGYPILLLAILCCCNLSFSQESQFAGPDYIAKLIEQKKIEEANKLLTSEIAAFKAQGNYDTLVSYIPLLGNASLSLNNVPGAIERAHSLVLEIKPFVTPHLYAKAQVELSNLYFTARQNDKVLEACLEGLKYVGQGKSSDRLLLSTLHYNIGTAHLNLGALVEAKKHLISAKRVLDKESGKNLNEYYNIYNSTGRYYASISQLDSSTYYYKKAVNTLGKMDSTEVNRDYWKAIVNNNIALNLQNVGNTQQAIEYIKNSISDYKKFMVVATDSTKKLRAQKYRLATIDNLGTFYHGLGEFNMALELMEYSYREKIKLLGSNDPNVVFSLAILGHGNLSAKNYEDAGVYLDKALELIDENPSNYSLLHSYTLALRASIFEALEQWEQAEEMYKKSESLYMQSFDGTYSKDYLDTMINMSLFYSKRGKSEKALTLANTGYRVTQNERFQNDLIHFHHIQNMANVHFELKNYPEALQYSDEALNFFEQNSFTSASLSDSIQIEFIKPRSLLINAKSKFHLQEKKSEAFLKNILAQVEEGVTILERRKTLIKTPEDLQILIDDNNDLFSFIKQIRLDLYEITKNDSYLLGLINAHESGIYNRIRSRLNIRNDISFANVPKEILNKEIQLKKKLSSALETSKINNFSTFFDATANWEIFLDSLKHAYPKYYKMRYGTIEKPLDQLQEHIPKTVTVVRYFFIDENLYAFVVSSSEKKLYPLKFKAVKEYIPQLVDNNFDVKKVSPKLFELYQSLWKPFEKDIKTERIIIIPDRELFNLSFELLTPAPINSFADLSTNSLLAKYIISYNFSLLLQMGYESKMNIYSENFVAFAPEFSEKMKEEYVLAITDSASIDRNYLTLLPQPFSLDIVKRYSKMFEGSSFINEKASKQLFQKNAGEHKIIHIGTHAESNNVSPELSRLIFAKNISEANIDDNFLYTYEIYDLNLSSQLAILTACETGKPTYQAGEGMISLAHAFTYAGSESILTSLWKIDEKSSALILASFYDNLAKGMPKDKALKEAKLTYLSTAPGRSIAPQYWAGLIIMGDTTPLELTTSSPMWYWWVGGLLLVLFLLYFFWFRRTKS